MQMDNKLRPLMNIVFPDDVFSNVPELFYRSEECLHGFGQGEQQVCQRYSFDTWMNLFAVKKWCTYCEPGKLFLRIHARGKIQIELIGHKLDAGFGLISDTLEVFEWDFGTAVSLGEFPVSVSENYDAVSLHATMGKGSLLQEAAWCTDGEPLRRNRMAVISCVSPGGKSFQPVMGVFHEFMKENPDMQDRCHLFVVDNTQTIKSNDSPYITVIPNMDAGWAGGFARGLMEANDGDYSRCLFLDGEANIMPESFFRTLMVADYLKDEEQEAFISGMAMDMGKKTLCMEGLNVWEGWQKVRCTRSSVVAPRDALRCIQSDSKSFKKERFSSSWRYACFSMESMKEEYPLPAVMGGEEAEWSWRRPKLHHLVFNGICVWQRPREWKTDRIREHYYLPRNMFVAYAVHSKSGHEELMGAFKRVFDYLVSTYDYASVDLLLTAMRDVLKGREAWAENPLKQKARLAGIVRETVRHVCGDKKELLALRTRSLKNVAGTTGMAMELYADPECYRGKEKVEVYNLLQESYELRIHDEAREERVRREFRDLLYQLGLHYEELAKHLRSCYEEFKTRKFWNKYLELER